MTEPDDVPDALQNSAAAPARPEETVARIKAQFAGRWEGPLPPPGSLQAYNRAFPGCAERIVAMAEAESRERHVESRYERETRRLVIAGDVYSQKVGLWLAFVLAVLVIGIGAFLIYTGHLAWGAGVIGFPLLSLVSIFILGRRTQSRELRMLEEQNGAEAHGPESELSPTE